MPTAPAPRCSPTCLRLPPSPCLTSHLGPSSPSTCLCPHVPTPHALSPLNLCEPCTRSGLLPPKCPPPLAGATPHLQGARGGLHHPPCLVHLVHLQLHPAQGDLRSRRRRHGRYMPFAAGSTVVQPVTTGCIQIFLNTKLMPISPISGAV